MKNPLCPPSDKYKTLVARLFDVMANLNEDDEGKSVVNADGEKIGVVADVDGGQAHIEPDPGITDEAKSKLGWGDADEDTFRLQDSQVDSVTDDEIRLSHDP